MSKVLLLALLMTSLLPAHGQQLDEKKLRRVLAEDYVRTFATEYNDLQTRGEATDIYGYFWSKAERKALFKNYKPLKVRAAGNKLIFEQGGKPMLELEVIDLFAQRYRINGQDYTHDWNGKPDIQIDLMKSLLQKTSKKTASLPERAFDLMFPRADAIVPFVYAAGAVAVRLCISACPLLVVVAQRTAVYVRSPAVRVAATRLSSGARNTVLPAMQRGGQKVRDYVQYAIDDIRTDPQILNALKIKATPASVVKAPFRGIAWIGHQLHGPVIGTTVGVSGGVLLAPIVQEKIKQAEKMGIPTSVAVNCILRFQDLKDCSAAKPAIELISRDAIEVIPYSCPSEEVNEFQVYTSEGDLQVIEAFRVGVEGENKGKPVSAMRYNLGPDKRVNFSSVRFYTFANSEVTRVNQPVLGAGAIPNDAFVPANGDPTTQTQQKKERIIARDTFLKSLTEALVIDGEQTIDDHVVDPLNSETDPEARILDQEVAWAQRIEETFKNLAPTCTMLESAATSASGAATPAAGAANATERRATP